MSVDFVQFHVEGTPRPQGSKRCFNNRPVEVSKHVAKWRRSISKVAEGHFKEPFSVPVVMDLAFSFARPKSHLTSKGTLKDGYPHEHVSRPDLDKLTRAVLDALTGVAYDDDSQVVAFSCRKHYGNGDGVEITVVPV